MVELVITALVAVVHTCFTVGVAAIGIRAAAMGDCGCANSQREQCENDLLHNELPPVFPVI